MISAIEKHLHRDCSWTSMVTAISDAYFPKRSNSWCPPNQKGFFAADNEGRRNTQMAQVGNGPKSPGIVFHCRYLVGSNRHGPK